MGPSLVSREPQPLVTPPLKPTNTHRGAPGSSARLVSQHSWDPPRNLLLKLSLCVHASEAAAAPRTSAHLPWTQAAPTLPAHAFSGRSPPPPARASSGSGVLGAALGFACLLWPTLTSAGWVRASLLNPSPGRCLSPPALALLAPAVLSPLLLCCRNPLLSSICACEFHEPRPARGCTCGPVAISNCLWKGQDGGFAREAACESAESPLSSRKRLRTG